MSIPRSSNSAQGPQTAAAPPRVAHSMLEHVALADHVEEHGEARHLAEAGPLEGLEVEAAEAAGVSHRTHAPSNSIRSKFQCRGTGL